MPSCSGCAANETNLYRFERATVRTVAGNAVTLDLWDYPGIPVDVTWNNTGERCPLYWTNAPRVGDEGTAVLSDTLLIAEGISASEISDDPKHPAGAAGRRAYAVRKADRLVHYREVRVDGLPNILKMTIVDPDAVSGPNAIEQAWVTGFYGRLASITDAQIAAMFGSVASSTKTALKNNNVYVQSEIVEFMETSGIRAGKVQGPFNLTSRADVDPKGPRRFYKSGGKWRIEVRVRV